jgi:hypothetical protein
MRATSRVSRWSIRSVLTGRTGHGFGSSVCSRWVDGRAEAAAPP